MHFWEKVKCWFNKNKKYILIGGAVAFVIVGASVGYILGVRIYDDLEVGDIIIFEHNGTTIVKRIAAIGGESIEVDGKIYNVPVGTVFVLGGQCREFF